jgi:hypothetical protein
VQIPVFKKAVDAIANKVVSPSDLPSSSKSLPSLAAVRINFSGHRLVLYRCSYFVFALSLLFAFYPYVREQFVWGLVLIVFLYGVWALYRKEMESDVIGTLGFADDQWFFEQAGSRCQLKLAGEVLCWPWIIILPFRETTTRKSRRLLIFNDALSREDNARLRAWLRACLVPKA